MSGALAACVPHVRFIALGRLAPTAAQLEWIDACDDANRLQTCATRAATASAADEIF